jgi:hypothetical protein
MQLFFLKALAAHRLKVYGGRTLFDLMDYLPAIMLTIFGILFFVLGALTPQDSLRAVCYVGGALLSAGAIYQAIYPVPPDHGDL